MQSQLKAGAILNYVIIVVNSLVGLLYTPYMLHKLGQSEYGLYSLVASVISYLTVLDLGFGNATVRYTAKYRAEGKQKEQYELFGMLLLFYIAISIVAMLLGAWLYFNVDSLFSETMTDTELGKARIMILILVLNLAFTFPMSIFGSIITAYEQFIFPKVVNIACILFNTIVMIILLHYGYRAIAMVVVQTFFNFFSLILQYFYCKYKIQIKILFGKVKLVFLWEICVYSFWIFLEVIINRVYWSTGQFVLAAVSGTIAVAIFAVAIQLHNMYMQFSTAISSVFLPKVTKMVATNSDNREISDLFIRTGRIQNIIMGLVLFGFIVFGKQFIILWAGAEYEDSYVITLLFFIALYIPLIQNLGISILQARNQMKFRSLLYVAIAVVALILQIIFAKIWGAVGCALAIAGALFLGQGIIMNIYYQREQHIDILLFWKEILKMDIGPILLSILFVYAINTLTVNSWLSLAFYGGIFFILYSFVMYKFGMNQSEKDLILGFTKTVKKSDRSKA